MEPNELNYLKNDVNLRKWQIKGRPLPISTSPIHSSNRDKMAFGTKEHFSGNHGLLSTKNDSKPQQDEGLESECNPTSRGGHSINKGASREFMFHGKNINMKNDFGIKTISGTISPNFDGVKNTIGITSIKSPKNLIGLSNAPLSHKFKFTPLHQNPNPELDKHEPRIDNKLKDNIYLNEYKRILDPFVKISEKYNILYSTLAPKL